MEDVLPLPNAGFHFHINGTVLLSLNSVLMTQYGPFPEPPSTVVRSLMGMIPPPHEQRHLIKADGKGSLQMQKCPAGTAQCRALDVQLL